MEKIKWVINVEACVKQRAMLFAIFNAATSLFWPRREFSWLHGEKLEVRDDFRYKLIEVKIVKQT